MKSMKKTFFVVLCVLVAFTLAIGLVACKDAGEPSSTYLYVSATETGDKAYSANVSVEGEELTFSNIDKANYGMEVVSVASLDEAVRQIAEFNITEVSATEIEISFVDTDYLREGDSFRLYSKSPVLSDNSNLDCSIYLQSVSYGLLSSESDINRYDNNIVLTMSLTDGTLVDTLTKENIDVSGALYGKEYTLTRVNDTTFSLTYVDAFKDDVSSSPQTTITLSSKAIKGNRPFNVFMDFEIKTPSAEIDSSAIQLITVGDGTKVVVPITLSDDFAKTINSTDVSVVGADGFTVEQVDLVGDNFMIVTLKTALNSAECLENLNVAKLEMKGSAVNLGGEKASMSFGNFKSDIMVTAFCNYLDEGFDGYVLNISAKNGTFKNYDSIVADDIQIKNTKDEPYNFTLTSKSEKMLVVKLNTTDTTIAGSVTIGSALIDSRFGLIDADLKGTFNAAYIEDDKSFTAIALPILTNMAKSLATSAASTVGSKIGAAITPYIMDFLGLERTPTLNEINKNVSQLGTQLYDLQQSVNAARATIERDVANSAYMALLDDYTGEYNDFTLYLVDAYGNTNGLAKMLLLEKEAMGEDNEMSNSELATLEAKQEYQDAKNVFVAEFEKFGAFFPSRIKTFGDNLKAKGAGIGYGYYHAYWGLMENTHLWDIQTITHKETFIKASASTYYLAMSTALRYLGIKGSSLVATYKASLNDTINVIESYTANLRESINRRSIRATLEYSTGKVVNLHIVKYQAKSSDNKSTNLSGILNVNHPITSFLNEQDFDKILKTARTKKVEFLKSLRDAGFFGAPSEGTKSIRIDMRRSQSSQNNYGYVPSGRYNVRKAIVGITIFYNIHYVTYTQNVENGILGGTISATASSTYATIKSDMQSNRQVLTYVDTANEYYMFDSPYYML